MRAVLASLLLTLEASAGTCVCGMLPIILIAAAAFLGHHQLTRRGRQERYRPRYLRRGVSAVMHQVRRTASYVLR